MQSLKMVALLERKKQGKSLDSDQIKYWIDGLVSEKIPDYQSSALLMAIRLRGMDFDETLALTQAMANSGKRLEFPDYQAVFDKHSTGGVGDKVTLILAPLLAACGLPVSMLSGRGLGHTGGTIDKFESLAGVSCRQSPEAMAAMLDQFGWANAQASEQIDPADRILYALRDVTATVDSNPLITASILSKKMAGGATHLCLDVKCGSAAFMRDRESAKELAGSLKTIGEMGGLKVSGFLTRMEEPLGHAIGNYLELLESVNYLRDLKSTPLMTLVETLGADMLVAGGKADDKASAIEAIRAAVGNGEGLERLEAYLRFTGGEPEAIKTLLAQNFSQLPRVEVPSAESGFIQRIDGLGLGEAMIDLGAGRKKREDAIDPHAGMVLNSHLGDSTGKGEPLGWLYGQRAEEVSPAFIEKIRAHFTIGEKAPAQSPIIIDSI